MVQRVVQRMVQRVTTSNKQWQPVVISANFPFLRVREEPTTKHPKENSLNLKEDLEELRAEASPYEGILTMRSRN